MEQEISRPSFLEVAFSQICEESSRSTCRIQVGAGLWRADKSLIAMAHNGSLPGEPHCEDTGVGCLLINGHCKRCDHAEHNAKHYAGVREIPGGHCLSTHEPCIDCFRDLVRLKISYVGYLVEYGNNTEQEKEFMKDLCRKKGITLEKFSSEILVVKNKILKRQQKPGGVFTRYCPLGIKEQFPTDWGE